MSATGAGYDLGVNTYSPDGRVFQVEYAQKAVDEAAGLALGLSCSDGVVLGVEKTMHSPLLLPSSNPRIFTVDVGAGVAFAGYNADGRPLAKRVADEAANYRSTWGGPVPPHELANRVGQFMHAHTVYGGYRPYGVSLLLAGYDEREKRAALHVVEPSGETHRYRAYAVGKARAAARTEIEKLDLSQLTVRQGVKQIARIIRVLHDDVKDKDFEFEASWVCEESAWEHERVPPELRREADAFGKAEAAALEESDDDDDDAGAEA